MQSLRSPKVSTSAPRGIWKRPKCAKCGKKIRDIKKIVRVDGKPYHDRCVETVNGAGESFDTHV